MPKILIISNLLRIGGAEKLLFEVVKFAQENNLDPIILILDNYENEYYDDIFRKMKIPVVRTQVKNILNLRSPLKMIKSVFWFLKLKYLAHQLFKSVHIIGMYNLDKVWSIVNHNKRYFWHVNNTVQFYDRIYPYSDTYFANSNDSIICINKSQITELNMQYGESLKSQIHLFKLFID